MTILALCKKLRDDWRWWRFANHWRRAVARSRRLAAAWKTGTPRTDPPKGAFGAQRGAGAATGASGRLP